MSTPLNQTDRIDSDRISVDPAGTDQTPARQDGGHGLLRFVTAGSVDDGKSTLIGRLLHDARLIQDDTLVAIETASERRGLGFTDLSLLTDGLLAEREQGITIDVAYRYFATPRRKFIVADCPGHRQYTRNMVTGASNADAAVLLVDATRSLSEQTRRHAAICGWLGLSQVILAVNKLDRVNWSREVFESIAREFHAWCGPLGIEQVHAIPISALEGDMIVERGTHLDWYQGATLLETLEGIDTTRPARGARFAVQTAVRGDPRRGDTSRAYAGRLALGPLAVGDEIVVVPGGQTARIASIHLGERALDRAEAGQSIALKLDRELDISRGDLLVHGTIPSAAKQLPAEIAWFAATPLEAGTQWKAKIGTRMTTARVETVHGTLDLTALKTRPAASVSTDDLARVELLLGDATAIDPGWHDSPVGRLILIDPVSGATVGAGMAALPA